MVSRRRASKPNSWGQHHGGHRLPRCRGHGQRGQFRALPAQDDAGRPRRPGDRPAGDHAREAGRRRGAALPLRPLRRQRLRLRHEHRPRRARGRGHHAAGVHEAHHGAAALPAARGAVLGVDPPRGAQRRGRPPPRAAPDADRGPAPDERAQRPDLARVRALAARGARRAARRPAHGGRHAPRGRPLADRDRRADGQDRELGARPAPPRPRDAAPRVGRARVRAGHGRAPAPDGAAQGAGGSGRSVRMSVHERTLITGGGGQLASDLETLLAERGPVWSRSREELDITDDAAVAGAMARIAPTVVYNCAAYHNVDACEDTEARSFEVNAVAVKRLAQQCAEHGARLVHVSTNYVFDGSGEAPWTEEDLPRPRSMYGLSKLAGEHAALAYAPDALVARTGGLYGEHGSVSKGGNFVDRMIARARNSSPPTPLRMVADQRLTPTATNDLAAALVRATDRGMAGLLHLTNGGACS